MSGKKRWMPGLAAITGAAVLAGGLAFTGTPPAQAADPHPVAIATLFTRGALGQERTVKGYVTAEYSEGGIGGFMVQKANSGGSPDPRVQAPQAIRVRGAGANVGDYVMVTGTVSDRGGLRGLDSSQDRVQGRRPKETARRPVPITDLSNIKGSWTDEASLARISGMLVQPKGDFTVTGLDQTGSRGEVGVLPEGAARRLGGAAASQGGSTGEKVPEGKASDGKADQKTSDQSSSDQTDVPLLMLDDGASQAAAERAPQRSWSGQQAPVVGDTVNFVAHSILMPAVNAPGRTDGWHFQPTTAITSDTKVLPTKITAAPSTRQSEPGPQAGGSAASTPAGAEPSAPATPAATTPLQKTREELAARARTAKEAAEKAGAEAEAKKEAAKRQAERTAAAATPTPAPSSARRLLAPGTASKPVPTPSSASTDADDEESDAGPLSLPAIPKAARGNLSRPITGTSGSSAGSAPQQPASSSAGNASGGSAASGASSSASRSGGAVTRPGSTGSTPAKGALQGGSTAAKNSHDVADPQGSTAQVIRLGSAQADPPLAGSTDQGRTATTVLVVVAACLAIAAAGAGFVQRRRSH